MSSTIPIRVRGSIEAVNVLIVLASQQVSCSPRVQTCLTAQMPPMQEWLCRVTDVELKPAIMKEACVLLVGAELVMSPASCVAASTMRIALSLPPAVRPARKLISDMVQTDYVDIMQPCVSQTCPGCPGGWRQRSYAPALLG
jgi:hypothetical protein